MPVPVTTAVPVPLFAVNRFKVSATVTTKVSLVVLPVSDRLTPPTGADTRSPSVVVTVTVAVGWLAVITGAAFTVTAMVAGVAVLPLLSLAVRATVSVTSVVLLSVRLASSALTCARVPLIVSDLLFWPVTVAPPTGGAATASLPVVSANPTVKMSPPVWPASLILTPAMVVA